MYLFPSPLWTILLLDIEFEGWSSFSFSTLKIMFHCFLPSLFLMREVSHYCYCFHAYHVSFFLWVLLRFSLYLCFQHVDHSVFIYGFLCTDSAWGSLTLDLWIDFIYQFGKILGYYLVSIFVLFFFLLLRLYLFMFNCLLLSCRVLILVFFFHFFSLYVLVCVSVDLIVPKFTDSFLYCFQSGDKPIKIILHL